MALRLSPLAAALASVFVASAIPAGPARAEPPAAPALAFKPATVNRTHLQAEPDAVADAAGVSPFATGPTPAAGSVLTAPATLNANTAVTVDALTVTQTGAGRAISGVINKTSNTLSAVKGITNGSGGGVNGVNSGTTGPAGKYQVTSAASTQPSLVATTAGTGNAVQAVITSTASSDTPAVLGQHLSGPSYNGIGVEGDGNLAGVKGTSDGYYGVWGTSGSGSGVYGTADTGTGVYGASSSGSAVYGYSAKGSGVYGSSGSGYGGQFAGGVALFADGNNIGLYARSTNGTGVQGYAQGTGYGVRGASASGIGVYGSTSNSGSYAGYFDGRVYASGAMYAASFNLNSDRALKQGFEPVQGSELLERIAALPITSWDYKATPGVHHIGPMAQDFKAAFGLGTDDTHIEVVDIAGVSLAAIQALQQQLKEKEARIEALEAQMQASNNAMSARLAALERAAVLAAASAAPTAAAQP